MTCNEYVNLVGEGVNHDVYGEGSIVDQAEGYVLIQFLSQDSVKKFSFPTSFKTFLRLKNLEMNLKVLTLIEQLEKEEDEKRNARYSAVVQSLNQKGSTTKGDKDRRVGDNRDTALPAFQRVEDFCEKFEASLIAEINYLRSDGGKRQRIFGGQMIEKRGGVYLYSFESDSELNYPNGTQITLWVNPKSIAGTIICCEDITITFALTSELEGLTGAIEFSAEPWKLMSALIDRLQGMQSMRVSPITKALICDGRKNIVHGTEIVKGQNNALKMALTQPITFIWGPPGTGKTETLAKIALKHIQRGSRVLMLSYSNVSVDGAIQRVFKLDDNPVPGKLLRYGYARDEAILQHEYLTSYNLVIHRHKDLLNERDKLLNERKKMTLLQKASPRYVEIQEALIKIHNYLIDEEHAAVRSAHFVATTVSKAIVDKILYSDNFDVVIFDEASMSYIPQIIFAASLAKKHFVCLGDFAQLPPIVQSSANSILSQDIFQYCGITDAVNNQNGHGWLCLLNMQYRMHPFIADFVSMAMYDCLLTSSDDMRKKRDDIVHSDPLSGCPIGLADLSGMMSVCTKTSDSSRVNPLSALITFGVALKVAKNYEVGIITPYQAQSRLICAMIRDATKIDSGLHSIVCATVHQFQGAEKDVIIYDSVDCYRQSHPGILLTSMNDNYANRLFNVAVTRAKGKFIAVTNAAYMKNKSVSEKLLFMKLINRFKDSKQSIAGSKLESILRGSSRGNYQWFDTKTGNTNFLWDIEAAKKEIHIDVPSSMSHDEELNEKICEALSHARAKGVNICIRTEDISTLPAPLRKYSIQNSYVANPIAVLDRQVMWFGEPLSEANFTSAGEALQTRCRPIIRLEGKHAATSIYGLLEMDRMIDQSAGGLNDDKLCNSFAQYIVTHIKCHKCGVPMKLVKHNGKFFLGCSAYPACKTTRLIDVDTVEKYFYHNNKNGMFCEQDGMSLEAKLGPYGIYVQCCGRSKHKYRLDSI